MFPTLYLRDDSTCTTNCNGYDELRKFNLSQLNNAYFTRLRARIEAAKERNIYVSIMLFNGWGVGVYSYFSQSGSSSQEWWRGHPYNPQNNVNSINGGTITGWGTGTPTPPLLTRCKTSMFYA